MKASPHVKGVPGGRRRAIPMTIPNMTAVITTETRKAIIGDPAALEKPAPSPYVAPVGPHKTKVPIWVMPVLIGLPVWAFLYPGAFGNHTRATAPADPLVLGQQIFHSKGCSGCHGNAGEGGVGPKLAGG